MAQVSYYVDDVVGSLCETLGVGNYTILGGHYAFNDAGAYAASCDAVYTAIWALLVDEDPDNDDLVDVYMAQFDEANSTVMLWSTEKGSWV